MRYTKSSWLILTLVFTLVLSACNIGQDPEPTPDVGAIFTAAAETVIAELSIEFTQTAQAAPTATQMPTNTPPATFDVVGAGTGSPAAPATTPIATFGIGTQPPALGILPTITSVAVVPTQGAVCLNAAFVADVTYPDDTVVKGGSFIAKVWSIKNTGTCTWDDGFSLQPVLGDALGGKAWLIDKKDEFVEPGEVVEIRVDMSIPKDSGTYGGGWRMLGDNGDYFGETIFVRVIVE